MNSSIKKIAFLFLTIALHVKLSAMNPDNQFLHQTRVNELTTLINNNQIDLNSEDVNGKTLLIDLIEEGNLQAVELIVAHGANVNKGLDCFEQPPLHCCIWNFQIDILKLLLKCKNNQINTPDGDGVLPLCTAAQGGNLINDIDDGSVTDSDLEEKLPICKAIIQLLVARGADINGKNTKGHNETALHMAVVWGLKELVQTLIDLGADTQVMDNTGKTPLMYAQEHDEQDIIDILTSSMSSS